MFALGDRLVDPATRRISRGSQVARLSPKAMGVLLALRAAGGKVLSRADLLDEVWPDVTVGEEVLTHAIAEIRRALGDSARTPHFVETVHKSGYRLHMDAPGPPASAGLVDLQNHAAYLDGCEMFFRGGPDNVRQAVERFAGVLEADPHHGLAHAGLAKAQFFLDKYFGPADSGMPGLEAHGRDAVALDPGSPDTHAALGFAMAGSGKYAEAMSSFATAVKLNPHLADTHQLLGRASLAARDFRMAATMLERAASLRPDDYHSLVLAAKARRSLQDETACRVNLARARRRIEDALLVNPDDRRLRCDRLYCRVEFGETDGAVDEAMRLVETPCGSDYYLVGALARVGEAGLALDCFEAVIRQGWSHAAWVACDPDLQDLRREPGFRRLEADLPAP